ncbi:hypothetical protein GCM10023335_02290 [Streptomyces siamensis]|uniref:HTH araC/xylS-type domain-containing protein n=1 Tax=Streptomyces siamensis TaxID=1274986 RepID=A0ABP9ID43_9ACTN
MAEAAVFARGFTLHARITGFIAAPGVTCTGGLNTTVRGRCRSSRSGHGRLSRAAREEAADGRQDDQREQGGAQGHGAGRMTSEAAREPVAHRCAPSSASAFIEVFRRAFGCAPGAHGRDARRAAVSRRPSS